MPFHNVIGCQHVRQIAAGHSPEVGAADTVTTPAGPGRRHDVPGAEAKALRRVHGAVPVDLHVGHGLHLIEPVVADPRPLGDGRAGPFRTLRRRKPGMA